MATVTAAVRSLTPNLANTRSTWGLTVASLMNSSRTSMAGEVVMGDMMTGLWVVAIDRGTALGVNRSVDPSSEWAGCPS